MSLFVFSISYRHLSLKVILETKTTNYSQASRLGQQQQKNRKRVVKIEDSRWSYQRSDMYPERFKAGETFEKNRLKGFFFSGGETNSDGSRKFSFKLLGYSSDKLCSLSFWLQFTNLSCLFSFILKAIKRCFNVAKQIKRCFPNQNPRKKKKNLWTPISENRERLSDIKNKNRKIEKTNIFMENLKAWNKKESKPKSNLNLSNKKTQ